MNLKSIFGGHSSSSLLLESDVPDEFEERDGAALDSLSVGE